MKLWRILIAIFACACFIHACALCALYSPTAHASIKFNSAQGEIKTAAITWTFSENFTELTLQNYDENADKILDKKETWNVQKSLLDYIVPRGYLTNVSFYDDANASANVFVKTQSQRVYLEGGRLNFEYVLELNLAIKDRRVIVFDIIDYEGFFNFKFTDEQPLKLDENLYIVPNANLNAIFFEMTQREPPKPEPKKELGSLIKPAGNDEALKEIDSIDEAKFDAVSRASLKFLDYLKSLIKQNSQEFSLSTFALIMAISLIYGFLHAAGPGHGKMLTASFFAANGGSYAKAFFFALKIGVLHVLGAFAMVGAMMYFLGGFGSKFTNDAANFTMKISAVVIVFIALYMLFTKFKNLKPKPHDYKFSPHAQGCSCRACQSLQTTPKSLNEWLIALAAALVPCPGTILVFTLAFSVGSFGIGALSGVFMALGMSAVIFIAAVFGGGVNEYAKFKNLRIYAEILALTIMIGLGALMFVASNKVSVL